MFAMGVTSRGPYKNGSGEINTDICCGGQVVHPGDLIVGDADGITVVDPDDMPGVLAELEKLIEKEAAFDGMIEQGRWTDDNPLARLVNKALSEQGYLMTE